MLSLFFELLQIALGHRSGLSHIPSEREWRELFFISQKQALLGIVYAAIEKLPPVQRPERKFLLRWHMVAESVKKKNSFLGCQSFHFCRLGQILLLRDNLLQYQILFCRKEHKKRQPLSIRR